MTKSELKNVLSVCYEELRVKNVPIKEELREWIELKLVSIFDTRYDVPKLDDINRRIRLLADEINSVAVFLKEIYEKCGPAYEKSLIERSRLIANFRFLLENIRLVKNLITGRFSRLPWDDLEFYIIIYLTTLTRNTTSTLDFDNIYLVVINDKLFYNVLLKFYEFCIRINVKHGTKNSTKSDGGNKVDAREFDEVQEFKLLENDVKNLRDLFYLKRILRATEVASNVRLNDEVVEGLVIDRCVHIIGICLNQQFSSEMVERVTKVLPSELSEIIFENRKSVNFIAKFDDHILLVEIQKQLRESRKRFQKILATLKFDLLSTFLQKCNGKAKLCFKILQNFKNVELIELFDEIFDEKDLNDSIVRLNEILNDKEKIISLPQNRMHELWNLFPIGIVTNNPDFINFWTINCEYFKKNMQLREIDLKDLLKQIKSIKSNDNEVKNIQNKIYEILASHLPPNSAIPQHYILQLDVIYETEKLFTNFMDELKQQVPRDLMKDVYDQINIRKEKYYKTLRTNGVESDYESFINKLSGFYENRFKITLKHLSIVNFFKSLDLPGYILSQLVDECKQQERKSRQNLQNEINEHESVYNQLRGCVGYSDDEMIMAMEILCFDSSKIFVETGIFPSNPYFFDEYSPILMEHTLHEYLSSCDAIYDALLPQPFNALAFHLNNYLCNKYNRNYEPENCRDLYQIIVKTNSMAYPDVIKKRYEKNLKWSEVQNKMLQSIAKDDIDVFREAIEMEADIRGVSLDKKVASHYFLKNQYLNIETIKCPKIHRAILLKHHDLVGFYAKKHINAKDNINRTPLHYAAQIDHVNIAKTLIHEGSRIDTVDAKNMTPLHISIIYGNLEMTKYLIEKGADPFKMSEIIVDNGVAWNTNGFMLAVMYDHKHLVKLFSHTNETKLKSFLRECSILSLSTLSSRIDYLKIFVENLLNRELNENKNDKDWTLLHGASFFGAINIIDLLTKIKRNIDSITKNNENVLHLASINNNPHVIERILSIDSNLSKNEDNFQQIPLDYAIKYSNNQSIDIIRKYKSDNFEFNNTMFEKAVRYNNIDFASNTLKHVTLTSCHCPTSIEMLELLYPQSNNTVDWLHNFCNFGFIEGIQFLVDHNENIINASDNYLNTPLHIATEQSQSEVVDYLLSCLNVEFNKNRNGETPLHIATRLNNNNITKLLLTRINVSCIDIEDINGLTPLYWSINHFNHKILKDLLKCGSNVNQISTSTTFTPLETAINCRNNPALKYLLEYGANPNIHTPLHCAIEKNLLEACKLLIHHGADVNSTSTLGMTPLHLAAYHHRNPIMQILLKSKALPNSQLICSTPLTPNEISYINSRQPQQNYSNPDKFAHLFYHQKTPLHFAIEKHNIDGIRMLVTHGASVNRCCSDNRSPLSLAQTMGEFMGSQNDDIENYLIRNGAKLSNLSIDSHLHDILKKTTINGFFDHQEDDTSTSKNVVDDKIF